jgi:hypothetical protein
MMKKINIFTLGFAVLVFLSGCSSGGGGGTTPPLSENDSFTNTVRGVTSTAPDDAEPIDIDGVTATTPEGNEPSDL